MAQYLSDGYQTLISFSQNGALKLKEKEVQPADIDGGGGIDTTTMRSGPVRTKRPKSLYTVGDIVIHANYDPNLYVQFVAIINRPGNITVTFPDGSVQVVFGWLDKFKPASLKEGEFPLAEITVIVGNQNADGTNALPINPN